MSTKKSPTGIASAQPHLHQREIQAYGTVNHALPLDLEEPVRLEITEQLNQLLADTMTIRDLPLPQARCQRRGLSRSSRVAPGRCSRDRISCTKTVCKLWPKQKGRG